MTVKVTRSDESRHDFAFIAGAIIGAISGALVTLALTPMSGAETREKLRSRAEDLGPIRDRAMEAAAPVKEKAMGAAAPVKEKAGSIAATASGKAQTLAASGKEKATDLAAKSPIGRGHDDELDSRNMEPDEANDMLSSTDSDAHPGGTMTAAALADAGADATAQPDAAAKPVGESGNGRVSESPSSGTSQSRSQ